MDHTSSSSGEQGDTESFLNESGYYEAGCFFEKLGAYPESFLDTVYGTSTKKLYELIQRSRHIINWEVYLQDFASIKRRGWLKERRGIISLEGGADFVETDLDHLILGACMTIMFYETYAPGNRDMLDRGVLMFLLHESDEFILGDTTPDEPGYLEGKQSAINPTSALLRNGKYNISNIGADIWNEWNQEETVMALQIKAIDHQTTIYKAWLYDKNIGNHDSKIYHEFKTYYDEEHANDPIYAEVATYVKSFEENTRSLQEATTNTENYRAFSDFMNIRSSWKKLIDRNQKQSMPQDIVARILLEEDTD